MEALLVQAGLNSSVYSVWKILRLAVLAALTAGVCAVAALLLYGKISGDATEIMRFAALVVPPLLSVKILERKTLADMGLCFRWEDCCYFLVGIILAFAINGAAMGLCLIRGENLFLLAFSRLTGASDTVVRCLLIAFAEELFFRGYLVRNTFPSRPFWQRNLLLSFLFMIPHIGTGGSAAALMAAPLALGLLLGYLYRITGSVWMGTGLHWVWSYCAVLWNGVHQEWLLPMVALLVGVLVFCVRKYCRCGRKKAVSQ